MTGITVVISQSPSNLTLSATNGYYIADDGAGEPARTRRNGYAAESSWVNGKLLVSSALDHSSLQLGVWVNGTSESSLRTRIDALTTAVAQFTYTVSVTVGGSTKVWTADPADWSLSDERWSGPMVQAFWQRVNLAIPVYPIPA